MCVMNIKLIYIYIYIYIFLFIYIYKYLGNNIQRPDCSPSPKMMVINKGNHPLLWPNYSG